jgi:hypothetical protein
LFAALTCLTKLQTRAVIMASHFLSRDLFLEGCCMEAPLSSVQEHLSAPLCSIHTQVYVEEHFCSLLLGLKQKKILRTSYLHSHLPLPLPLPAFAFACSHEGRSHCSSSAPTAQMGVLLPRETRGNLRCLWPTIGCCTPTFHLPMGGHFARASLASSMHNIYNHHQTYIAMVPCSMLPF